MGRKRKVERSNSSQSSGRKKKSTVFNPTDPTKISPADCIKEFLGECLEARHGKLFSVASQEELSLKTSTVKEQISSGNKHKNCQESLAREEARVILLII